MKHMEFELKDGESWDDIMTLHLRREEAAALLAVAVTTAHDVRTMFRVALLQADEGDMLAARAAIAMKHSVDMYGDVVRKITELILPDIAAEAAAEAQAERDKRN